MMQDTLRKRAPMFSWFFSVSPGKYRDNSFRLTMTAPVQVQSISLLSNNPTAPRYTV
jgi:hypothetical protein